MTRSPQTSYGRAAILGVLIALVLIVCAGVYLFMARFGVTGAGAALGDPELESRRLARLTILLTILLVSALLILLFVVGAYLVIRAGRIIRSPLAGKPTEYVDAWKHYRLTDEQIAAATAEHPPAPDGDRRRGDADDSTDHDDET